MRSIITSVVASLSVVQCLGGCASTADIAGVVFGEREVIRPATSGSNSGSHTGGVQAKNAQPPQTVSQDAIPVVVVDPSQYTLTYNIFSFPGQNPDINNRPSPLQIRVYQLEHDAMFKSADYLTLYKNDKQVLGPQLLGWEPVMVFPGQDILNQTLTMSRKTYHVGVLGAFQEYEGLYTTQVIAIDPLKPQLICIFIQEDGLKVGLAETTEQCQQLKR